MITASLTDPIVAPSRLSAAQVKAWYVDNWGPVPTPVAQYLDEAERLCGAVAPSRTLPMDLLIFVAQSIVETADPDTGNPWMSSRWTRNHNPAGLAVESNSDPDPARFTPKEAATVQYWAWLYMTRRTSTQVFTPESANPFVERWTAKIEDPMFPYPIRTIADLCRRYVDAAGEPQATWAWDQTYAAQLVARANELLRFAAALPEGGTTPMPEPPIGQYITDIPGLPGGPLRTTYPITMRIVPEGQTLNRPGIKAKTPRVCVQHGNGNPNATAAADAQWLFNGARNDAGQPQQVSFHATADDTGVWMCIPADEVTWQAADGDGPGNMNGFSCEQSELAAIWTNESRARKCIAVTADFMGRCGARLGIAKPGQHWDYNYNNAPSQRHDCPNKLRHAIIGGRPAWDIYVEQWNAARLDELGLMNPSPPVAEKPIPSVPWGRDATGPQRIGDRPALAFLGEVTAKRDVPIRVTATPNGEVFARLTKGSTAAIRGTYRAENGTRWALIETNGGVGRALLSAFTGPWPTL